MLIQFAKAYNRYTMLIIWNNHAVSWEPEGRYHYSTMFRWEPEGRYHCTKSMLSLYKVYGDNALLVLIQNIFE